MSLNTAVRAGIMKAINEVMVSDTQVLKKANKGTKSSTPNAKGNVITKKSVKPS